MLKHTKKNLFFAFFLVLFVANSQAQQWKSFDNFEIEYKLPSDWWVDGFGDYSRGGWDEHGSSVCECTGVIIGLDDQDGGDIKMLMYPSTEAGLKNPERQKAWDFEWVEPTAAQKNIQTATFNFEFKTSQWKDDTEFEVWQLKTQVDKDFYLLVYFWATPNTLKNNLKTLTTIISSINQVGKRKKPIEIDIPLEAEHFKINVQNLPKDTATMALMSFPSEKKWGFIDAADENKDNPPFFIPAIYDYVEEFDASLMGYATVGIGKKYGMIDKTGKVYIPLKYDSMMNLSDLAGDACVEVSSDKKYGVLCPNGEELVPCVYKMIETIAVNGIHYAVTTKGKKYGIYDILKKKEFFSDTFDEFPMLNPMAPEGKNNNVIVIKNKKYGVLDMDTMQFLLECTYPDNASVQEAYVKKFLEE